MSDSEKILTAVEEAQLVLAGYIELGRDSDQVLHRVVSILNHNEVVEACDRLEAELGMRHPN